MKICISVPANKPIRVQTVKSIIDMIGCSPYEILFLPATEGYTPSEKRNWALVQSLNVKCDFTFFTDDDMVFPKETLKTLVSRDKDVIGGLYYLRGLPLKPVVEFLDGMTEWPNEPFEVKGVGAGLMLIKNEILKRVKTPWFGTEVNELGQTKLGDSYWFGDRVREAGFEIWVDPSLSIQHIGDYLYG